MKPSDFVDLFLFLDTNLPNEDLQDKVPILFCVLDSEIYECATVFFLNNL